MKFKRFRYNLITIGLVAIIACCVALPLVTGGSSDINQGTSIEDSVVDDTVMDEIPEDIVPGEDVDDEEGEEEEDEEEVEIPSSPIELIEYSFNMLYQGKGFEADYNQTVVNLAMGIAVTQSCTGKIFRNGKDSLQENYFWSTYTGIGSDQVKNYYQYFNVDRTNNTFSSGTTGDYSKDKKTYNLANGSISQSSIKEGYDKYVILLGDENPLPVPQTKNKSRKDSVSDPVEVEEKNVLYYDIEVTYNLKNVPDAMKNYYGSTGQLTNIRYNSLTVIFRINAQNGKMKKITRIEKMLGDNALAKNVDSTSTTIMTFKNVDKEQTIVIPQ